MIQIQRAPLDSNETTRLIEDGITIGMFGNIYGPEGENYKNYNAVMAYNRLSNNESILYREIQCFNQQHRW